jgi:hypothetical protein
VVEIKLYTADGGYVGKSLIPPFVELPPIIIWGSRIFKLGTVTRPNYYECYCFAVTEVT